MVKTTKPLFIAVAIVAVILASGCTQTGQVVNVPSDSGKDAGSSDSASERFLSCPASCSDSNPCTEDLCSGATNFKCTHEDLGDDASCGDGMVCKSGECVTLSDQCTGIYKTYGAKEGDKCYDEKYITEAVKKKDASICEGIVSPAFSGKCYGSAAYAAKDNEICEDAAEKPAAKEGYGEDVSPRDDCYMFYARSSAEKLFVFDSESCSKIVNSQMEDECSAFLKYVTEPVSIKEFFVGISNDPSSPPAKIVSYIVLKDRKGRTAVSDGRITVYISEQDKKGESTKLYYKAYDVSEDDFKPTNIGGFAYREEIAYVFSSIESEDLEELPSQSNGKMYVTFTPEGGTPFSTSGDLSFGF